jgi:hypothetical protein
LNEVDLPLIKIYQSDYFKIEISKYTQNLVEKKIGVIVWTENVEGNLERSLKLMREKMISENNPIAAIFIGGMEGIEEEFEIYRKKYPNRSIYLIGSTGGATRILSQRYLTELDTLSLNFYKDNNKPLSYFEKSKLYANISEEIFSDIIKKIGEDD